MANLITEVTVLYNYLGSMKEKTRDRGKYKRVKTSITVIQNLYIISKFEKLKLAGGGGGSETDQFFIKF